MLSFAINPICQASTLLPPIQAIRKIFFVWLIAIDSCIYIYIYISTIRNCCIHKKSKANKP